MKLDIIYRDINNKIMTFGKHIVIFIKLFVLMMICFLLFISLSVQAQQTILPVQLPECPVKRVMDATLTSNDVLWVVGEQSGVYSLNLKEPLAKWTHVSAGGAFDPSTNYYAIIEDKQGRIWIGTDNQGVLVSEGKSWKSYTVDNALLANRVYDLAVSPFTGEVAIATSSGVSLFNPMNQSWKDFTRANGLLEDQVSSLAFTKDGEIWFAYACGGLTKAEASHPLTSCPHSRSKCNTEVKSEGFDWGSETKALPGSGIKELANGVQFALGYQGKVRLFGQKSSHKPYALLNASLVATLVGSGEE